MSKLIELLFENSLLKDRMTALHTSDLSMIPTLHHPQITVKSVLPSERIQSYRLIKD